MKKSFEEVFIDKTRYGTKIKTDEYCKSGKHIIVDQSQNAIAGFTDLDSGLFTDVPAIIFGDHTRVIKYVDEPFFLGADGTKILRSNICNANYKYLYYALKNARIPNTGYNRHFKWLKEIEIQYPDEKTQNNIASLLDKVLYVINLRKDELQKLDDLIRARFVELFGDPATPGDKFKTCKLGEVADVKSSHRVFTTEFVDEGVPFYRGTEIGVLASGQRPDDPYRISMEHYLKIASDDSKPMRGDLLLPSICNKGQVWMVDTDEPFYYKDGRVLCISPDRLVFDSRYLQFYMKMRTESEYPKLGSGSTFAEFKIFQLKELVVDIPPMNVQKSFDLFADQIDKSKSLSPHLPIPPLKWYPLPKNEVPIMEEKIIAITNEMAEVLNIAQLKKLQEVLVKAFSTEEPERKPTNHEYLRLFLEAKSIEGCSPRTLQYYEVTVQHLFAAVNMPVRKMTTERMREYLSDYQQRRNCSKATIDNIRRNISSFFSWLEEEDHILKSPMRRIHKIKTKKTVKEVISDEDIEKLRDSCTTLRDLAMIDLLYSTGIRAGELVRLNIEDVNFESRECVVFGKGDKERRVYFDAKTKIHLKNYLESRRDTNRALFVSLLAPYNRLAISGVEIRLRKMGRMLNLKSIHPHKFRRTMATRAIDKGMPIEQVQKILGHSQIDTTMQYAIVNQNNVKMSHQKYIA